MEADDARASSTSTAATTVAIGTTKESKGGEQIERAYSPSLRSGEHGEVGCREDMEDATVMADAVEVEGAEDVVAFYGVFDGHGGRAAAEFLRNNLMKNVVRNENFISDPERALKEAFFRTDQDFYEACEPGETSGSTGLAACVIGGKLYIANAGDCRAVLSRKGKAIDLSIDQKPSSQGEMERIKNAGGFVEDGYVNGLLGVSRAFGDWHLEGLKGQGGKVGPLTVDPEVEKTRLTEDDEFLILACDGLWDVFSSQNAIDVARSSLRQHNDPAIAARELAEEALRRDSSDNVSVVCVCLTREAPKKETFIRTAPSLLRSLSVEAMSLVSRAMSDDATAEVPAAFAPKRVQSIRNFSGADVTNPPEGIFGRPSATQVSEVLNSIVALNVQNNVQTGALGLERRDSDQLEQSTCSELDTLEEEAD
jgi:protein phosphatase 2C family protein 2/3